MEPSGRSCLPLFSFMRFIDWLIPWSWFRDSRTYSQIPGETSTCVKSSTLDSRTDEFSSVSEIDLEYLSREEAKQIIEQFKEIPQSYNRLVFWTGIPREWVQQWADEHDMLTLTSAMGPLMDRTSSRCLKRVKELEEWSKYVKGASRIFARFACGRGIIRVLTLPPTWAEFIRPESTYRNIEKPILKGAWGTCCAVQINTVHLLTTLKELEYQTWPENCIPESLRLMGAGSFGFRVPSWTKKAVKAATASLGRNVVSLRAIQTSQPANADVKLQNSVRKISESQPAEKSKDSKQSASEANARGSLKRQSQQPRSKTQLQTQQQQNKEHKPQAQQTATNMQQSKGQQPKVRKKQTKKSHSKKKQQQQDQQSRCEKQKPQDERLQKEEQRPQNRKLHSKTQQPQSNVRPHQDE